MPKHLTIRGVTPDLSRAIEDERRRRNTSLNRAVLDLLRRALGLNPAEPYSNGLAKFAGGWTKREAREFEKRLELFEQIDEELWR